MAEAVNVIKMLISSWLNLVLQWSVAQVVAQSSESVAQTMAQAMAHGVLVKRGSKQ
jgi:hypothetical protein